jgi:hypothetical protein
MQRNLVLLIITVSDIVGPQVRANWEHPSIICSSIDPTTQTRSLAAVDLTAFHTTSFLTTTCIYREGKSDVQKV